MTRSKFTNYELVFDYWPAWGNDASVVHRSNRNGRSYSTPFAYMSATSFGGVWGEPGFASRDLRPFNFAQSPKNLSIPYGTSSWTTITRNLRAAGEEFDCPETGCTQSDWQRLWDFEGWNEIRVKIYGSREGSEQIRSRIWFRKPGAQAWIPLMVDTTLNAEVPAGYIGLLVHGSGRHGAPKGTWYRNIRWQPLLENGDRIAVNDVRPGRRHPKADVRVRVEPARQAATFLFQDGGSKALTIYTLEGRAVARMDGVRERAVWNTAGRSRGVYLLQVGADGAGGRVRFMLP